VYICHSISKKIISKNLSNYTIERIFKQRYFNIIMAKLRGLSWGIIFSLLAFGLIYFFIYSNIEAGLGDTGTIAIFFSNIWNVIIFSLIVGFLLGILTSIRIRKKII
jgi:ABC-type antimicrobial peptide transport system permease subunit